MKNLIYSLLVVTSGSLSGQSNTFQVKVLEKGSGDPLKRVEVKSGKAICFTKKTGICELKKAQMNSKLTLYRVGYNKLVQPVDAKQDSLEIYLFKDQPDDNTIIITGEQKKDISQQTVSAEIANKIAPRGDPAQIVKLLPGVSSDSFNPKVVIRGADPNDSRYYIDEYEVPFIFHAIGGLSILPRQLLENVELKAGGFGVREGDIRGGLVTLNTRTDPAKKDNLELTVNLPFFSSVFYEGALDENSSYSVSFRKAYVDFFVKAFVPEGEVVVVPDFGDAHLEYITKNKTRSYKFFFITSYDRLYLVANSRGNTSNSSLEFDIDLQFALLGLEYKRKFDDAWRMKFNPHFRYNWIDNKFNDNTFKINGTNFTIPIEFTKKRDSGEISHLGFEFQIDNVDLDLFVPVVNRSDPFFDIETAPKTRREVRFRENKFSAWFEHEILADNLSIIPGVRAYYFTQIKENPVTADPRIRFTYKLGKNNNLNLSMGQYSMSPEPRELDKRFGNENLGFERSYHFVSGWGNTWDDTWTTDFQVYLKQGRQLAAPDPLLRYLNTGKDRSFGLEVFIKKIASERAFYWLSYNLSKTQIKNHDDPSWRYSEFDQTHNMNLAGYYDLTGQLGVGGRINLHSGDRYTSVVDAYYNANSARYSKLNSEERNGEKLPFYYQVDIYSHYDFLYNDWKLKLKGGVEYLALERPAFGVTYNYDYTKKDYFRGLPPIPYIELQGTF